MTLEHTSEPHFIVTLPSLGNYFRHRKDNLSYRLKNLFVLLLMAVSASTFFALMRLDLGALSLFSAGH